MNNNELHTKENKSKIFLFIGIAVALGIYIGSFLDYKQSYSANFQQNSSETKLKKLINYIEHDYVDKVNKDSLLDGAITQIMKNLDPHSVYIPKSELTSIQESMNGSFKGIGISFRVIRDTVTVLNVIEGGPSEKAGLLDGDRILIANNDTLFGKHFLSSDIMKRLKGEGGSSVSLKIYRKQTDSILDFDFKRGDVNLVSVPVYYMLRKTIGYIQIERFARNTYDEFHKALIELKNQGMLTLVLDLRRNTGGYMDIANSIIDEFLKDGKLIVFTKNKKDKITKTFATDKGDFEDGNIYLLIDEESASASEIVAGALQDNDIGTIIGRRSFGKGLVQREMELGDGSAIRLTTSRYYTPTGRSIQKPYTKGDSHYNEDRLNRILSGELTHKDSIPIVDSLIYTTPKGKIVYGGGGIIPDVFVAKDTTLYYTNFHTINSNDFVFDYIDERRSLYANLTWDTFNLTFDENALLKEYLALTKQDYHISKANTDFMKLYLKALVARELFGKTGYFRVWEERDLMLQKVLELENNKD